MVDLPRLVPVPWRNQTLRGWQHSPVKGRLSGDQAAISIHMVMLVLIAMQLPLYIALEAVFFLETYYGLGVEMTRSWQQLLRDVSEARGWLLVGNTLLL